MRLRDIQKGFKAALLDPARLRDDPFRILLANGPGPGLESRIKIYRNNVIRTLTGALAAAMPHTRERAGDELFERLARRYAAANLPAQGNLNLYGMDFPAFLASAPETATLPWLPDLARLECAREAAFYAADDAPLSPAALAALPQESLPALHLSPRASCALIRSPWPLDAIMEGAANIERRDTCLMVLRPALDVLTFRLDAEEYVFLETLTSGATMEEAANAAGIAFDLAKILEKHLRRGTFAEFAA